MANDWRTWEVHPLAYLMPAMTAEEFQGLKADIEARGLQDAIVRYEGKILDGRHRHRACVDLGIRPEAINLSPATDPVAYVISKNVHRRHLSVSQRAMLATKTAMAAKLATKRAAGKKVEWADLGLAIEPSPLRLVDVQTRQIDAKLHPVVLTTPEATALAKAADVSLRTLRQAQAIQNKAIPAVTQAIEERKVKLGRAEAIADLPRAEQADALEQAIAETGTRKAKATPEEKDATYGAAVVALLRALEPFEAECRKQLSRKPRTGTSFMTLHETTARNLWEATKALREAPKPTP